MVSGSLHLSYFREEKEENEPNLNQNPSRSPSPDQDLQEKSMFFLTKRMMDHQQGMLISMANSMLLMLHQRVGATSSLAATIKIKIKR